MFQIRKKISHRFFLAIIMIAVIPIALMGYEAHIVSKRALSAFAFSHMATIAGNHANHLDTWFRERLHDIGVIAHLPAIREACRQAVQATASSGSPTTSQQQLKTTLDIIERRSPSYENLYVLLPSGRILVSTHPLPETHGDWKHQEVMRRLSQENGPAFGPVYHYEDREGWHVNLAATIKEDDGSPLGFVVAVLDLSKTIDPILTERIGLGETGETYLVNRDRRIISQSRFLEWHELWNRSFETFGIDAVLNQESGTAVYENYLGREVLGSYMWLPRYEWGILSEMEVEEILWPLKWIRDIGIVSIVLVSGICLLMAYVVSRRISDPIRQVADAAQKMAEGDLQQRIDFTGVDELGRLASSFNVMAQQLSQSINSLRRNEDHLQKAYNERVTMQQQLIQSEKMAAIGELVASVAHEMRNPLSSVKLNLQIIGRSLDRESTLFEHYGIAIDQVSQMEKMFSDLLNYSKPLDLQRERVSIAGLIEKGLQQLAGEIANRGLSIRTTTSEEPVFVMVDAGKMEQVFVNVLKNAMEAGGPKSSIEVRVDTDRDEEVPRVTVAISDKGCGIPQRNLKNIFQPFFTTKKKGTGLGLCVVKKIMDAHQGETSIVSEEDRGTTVLLKLPCE